MQKYRVDRYTRSNRKHSTTHIWARDLRHACEMEGHTFTDGMWQTELAIMNKDSKPSTAFVQTFNEGLPDNLRQSVFIYEV